MSQSRSKRSLHEKVRREKTISDVEFDNVVSERFGVVTPSGQPRKKHPAGSKEKEIERSKKLFDESQERLKKLKKKKTEHK